MGKRNGQDRHGIVLLDKASGVSSNYALQQVRRQLNAKKAGHTGSLDPLASGLLPICLGQATKVCEYLLHGDKRYHAIIKLGISTDSYDSEGQVQTVREVKVDAAQLEQALTQFRGVIEQTPPMYSALKQGGQPLYKLARQGKTVARQARTMQVYELNGELIGDKQVHLDLHCSSGFYVRSLASDLGEVLGCGAHLIQLRRTQIRDLTIDAAMTFEQLQAVDADEVILPIDSLLQHLPEVMVSDQQKVKLLNGLAVPLEAQAVELTRIYSQQGELIALGRLDNAQMLKTHKVFVC